MLLLVFAQFACRPSGSGKSASIPGKEVYGKYCLACHQTDGTGVPGMYPPLSATDWVTGDKARLIEIVIKGQQGEIEVNGKIFKGVMPPHLFLTDEQIASVLSYVRGNFGNRADSVLPEEVAAVREKLKAAP
jgi:mono/diheme cytochrome c family protein